MNTDYYIHSYIPFKFLTGYIWSTSYSTSECSILVSIKKHCDVLATTFTFNNIRKACYFQITSCKICEQLNLEFCDHTNNGLRSSSAIVMRITEGEPRVTPACCASSGIIILTPNTLVLSVIESWMISTPRRRVTCNGFKVTFVLNG